MVRLINARQANGDWFDMDIDGGRIVSIKNIHNNLKEQDKSTVPLMSVGDFAALPQGTVVDAGGRTAPCGRLLSMFLFTVVTPV